MADAALGQCPGQLPGQLPGQSCNRAADDDDNGGISLTSVITSGQGICLLKFSCSSFSSPFYTSDTAPHMNCTRNVQDLSG